ncbi:hypothetical protein BH23ACT11_BH23ACT11_24470 [soil metagenome]
MTALFGPAFGPAVEAQGRSFAERVSEDENLVAEVLARFEANRAEGEFSTLSEILAGASCEERERFFREGWTREILPEPPRKPWDDAPWYGNLEAYREDLYFGIAFGLPDFRAFSAEWIEELARVGYYGMEESLGLPLKQQADDFFTPPRPLPLYGESYPVRLGDTRQTVWISLDGPRSRQWGYREVTVSEEPLRTDKAILAAVTALEGRPLDVAALRKVLPQLVPTYGKSVWDRWTEALKEDGRVKETLREPGHHQALDYVLTLLRYHHSGFDDRPLEDRADLIAETCIHINEFLEALRKFVAFLEHGTPGRRGPAATRVTARDVRAAILKDVHGMTYKEIGEELGIHLPADFDLKGDHPTVRKMVRRGRAAVEGALGEEGWQTHTEAMRAKMSDWLSRSELERAAEIESEALNIDYEEALQRVEQEDERHGRGPGTT